MHCPTCNNQRTTIMRTRPDCATFVHTRVCRSRLCREIFTTAETIISNVEQPTPPPIPAERVGLPCPACGARTNITHTDPDKEDLRLVGFRRRCKNPDCGVIFSTVETLLAVSESAAAPPVVRALIATLANLEEPHLEQARKVLELL